MIPLSEPCLSGREMEYVADCVNTGWISSNGAYVGRFEKALADKVGVDFAIACNCGTSALHISLLLSGIRPGDEVIVPTVTFIAPVNAIRYVGALPVFVDCDEYCNIDVAGMRSFLRDECCIKDGATVNRESGRRVAAVIPVHVFGTPADVEAVSELAEDYHLAIIEDASEALGSKYKGKNCGALAPLACLSFNGNKIVTSGGGGAILTSDETLARAARYLTTQAKEDGIEYLHGEVGYNYRMNNVLAALGLAQLETLDERLSVKRRNFSRYERALGAERLIQQPTWSESNRWFYGYLCADSNEKERIIQSCIAQQIQVRPLWYPNHLQAPYLSMRSYRIERAGFLYDRLLNLPCSVSLTAEQITLVTEVIRGETSPMCEQS